MERIRCTIIGSDHADISVGTEGFILGPKDDGYEVEIHGNFAQADTPTKRDKEIRIVYFTHNQIRIIGK